MRRVEQQQRLTMFLLELGAATARLGRLGRLGIEELGTGI